MKKKNSIEPGRLTLRGWAALSEIVDDLKIAVEEGNINSATKAIIQYAITAGFDISYDDFWIDVVEKFTKAQQINSPAVKFPILLSKEKESDYPWDYRGRSWYFWLNIFARAYGWSEEQVASLDIDAAIGLLQEISVDDQLEKEFRWGMSENAFRYSSATKKSTFVPLERPEWMKIQARKQNKQPKKTLIRRDMVPVGNVVELDEDGN